ncbi:MAG: hypothetical protein ACI4NV_06430 [Thermoguttaceae bacterium]
MKNQHSTLDRSRRLAVVALLIVSAASLMGCVSRKQYAINESILIGERRQLEDEIYRVQFQLRDALVENQQLREKLKNDGVDPDEYLRKNRSAPTQNANPFIQNYPGLNVGATTPNAPSSLALQKAMAQNATAPSTDSARKVAASPVHAALAQRNPNATVSAPPRATLAATRADVVAAQNARLANLVAPRAGAIRQTSALVPQNYSRAAANLEEAPTQLVAPQPATRPARLEERPAPLAQSAPDRVPAYKAPVFTPREETTRTIRVPTYEEAFDRAAELDAVEAQDLLQDEDEEAREEYVEPNSDDDSTLDEENAQESVEDEWAPLP